jgi:hypothetical protein
VVMRVGKASEREKSPSDPWDRPSDQQGGAKPGLPCSSSMREVPCSFIWQSTVCPIAASSLPTELDLAHSDSLANITVQSMLVETIPRQVSRLTVRKGRIQHAPPDLPSVTRFIFV